MPLTTWLIAKEDEADAIASTVTKKKHSVEDWTFIEFPLIETELMALSAAIRGTENITGESTVEGPLVFDENSLIVARVVDTFIRALAGLDPAKLSELAGAWSARMERDPYQPEQLQGLLSALVTFAQRAVERQSPVLSLVTFQDPSDG